MSNSSDFPVIRFESVEPCVPIVSISGTPVDFRQVRVDEFFQARSLSPRSMKDYRWDLQQFMFWTETPWNEVTRRQVAQFKSYLLTKREFAGSSVNRVMQTLRTFYRWMLTSEYVSSDPTIGIEQEKLPKAKSKDLEAHEIEKIYAAIAQRPYKERDRAIFTVLQHGLRSEEVSNLDLGDYTQFDLNIRQAKADSTGAVPLFPFGSDDVEAYLEWRIEWEGKPLDDSSPLFISTSRRNKGERLSRWGIYKMMTELSEATGIHLHSHRGRHTYCTYLMVVLGLEAAAAMKLSRHKDIRSYERYTNRKSELAAKNAFHRAIAQLPKDMTGLHDYSYDSPPVNRED
jgi:integrase/recombinase XerD